MRKAGILSILFAVVLFAVAGIADAQQSTKVQRIGYQGAGSPDENEKAFRQVLREMGYVEGQNIMIEWRFAEGKADQAPQNATELVRLVDVIVTGGRDNTRTAKGATSTIPIVMTNERGGADPGSIWRLEAC